MYKKNNLLILSSLLCLCSLSVAGPSNAQDAFGSGDSELQARDKTAENERFANGANGGSNSSTESLGATGLQSYSTQTTGSQTQQLNIGQSPVLQGATNGTIAPQGIEATVVQGVNTAGTVRVNNLANLEALLNIIANGMEILGIAWGGPTIIMGCMHMAAGSHDALKKILFGAAGVTGGLATPGCINWLVASCRDAALFN